jgi:two-component system chemotaxis sensor kinase CheA
VTTPAAPTAAAAGSDLISDHEFESLLDELHGKGKFTEVGATTGATASVAAPVAKAVAPKPVAKAPEPKAETPAPAPAAAVAPAPARAPAAPPPEKPASEAETTVRVDTARLDEIMNMVGELVLVRNRLVRLGANSADEAMSKAVSNLDVVTADLQTAVMKTRMQPIKKVFGRFPRLVRDLARQLKKEINLELVGEETDLDKNLVEALADPLVHLVRNSVDHGIEEPAEREAMGKPRSGKVILSAEQEGDHILLSISDDGKGMDADVLRGIAVKKGLMDKDAADRLSESDCFNLIFAPGFSTKTEISDVSGRGVGMDVVKTKIAQLNGTINIYSTKGKGSKIVIKVPLTLAIMPTLMVMLGNQAFAFPLVNVNEIFHLDLSTTNVVDGQEVVIVRDKALPLFYLKRWLVSSAAHEEQREGHVVILSVGTQRIGFVVDQLVGQEEVVIKPLGKMLQGTPGMSGATITGDGRIALILDVPSMLKRYAARRI